MTSLNYRNVSFGLIGAWFTFAVGASALNLFRNDPDQLPLPLLVTALAPIVLFLLWSTFSPGFRQFANSLSAHKLTIVQTWRINGFLFIILWGFGVLPAIFAIPAGVGDMAIGATAPLIARKLADHISRRGFIWWQVLGITDLLMAVTLGAAARFISPHATTTSALTVLPLSLVPAFIVPFLLILHLICIAQALHSSGTVYGSQQERSPSSAV